MINLEDAGKNVGRKVIYTDTLGFQEEGIISSVNKKFIFVRYGEGCTAQATSPEDLTYLMHY